MTFVPKCVKDCIFSPKPWKEIETRFEGKTDGREAIYLKFPQILSCIYCSIAIEIDVSVFSVSKLISCTSKNTCFEVQPPRDAFHSNALILDRHRCSYPTVISSGLGLPG